LISSRIRTRRVSEILDSDSSGFHLLDSNSSGFKKSGFQKPYTQVLYPASVYIAVDCLCQSRSHAVTNWFPK